MKSKKRMHSIGAKILISVIMLTLVSLGTLGVTASAMMYTSSKTTLEKTMTELAHTAAGQVNASLQNYETIGTEIASIARLSSSEYTIEDRLVILKEKQEIYGFEDCGYIALDGTAYPSGSNLSDRDYFQRAKEGNVYITEPFYSEALKKMSIVLSAPVKVGGAVTAVIYFVLDANSLSAITNNVTVGETGSCYMIDQKGNTIAHSNPELVLNRDNTQKGAETDPQLVDLANLKKDLIAGNSGFGEYSYDKTKKIVAYSPVGNQNGWGILVNAHSNEFMGSTYKTIMLTVGVALLFLIIGILVAVRLATSISRPIKKCVNRIVLITEGDLKSPVPQITTKDETAALAGATASLTQKLNAMIDEIAYVLGEMAVGNFTVKNSIDLPGDVKPVQTATTKIIGSLNSTLLQIGNAAEQVSSSAKQVSDGAQASAAGATEQAGSIEELSATIQDVSAQIESNSKKTKEAAALSMQAGDKLHDGTVEMGKMLAAMDDISHKSGEIGKIIKTIEDIAFQTNILALNAAVEAARAGDAGRGFAVVADEVRNLAGKSAEAAKNTTELIGGTISAVEKGGQIAKRTAEALDVIGGMAEQSVKSIEDVAAASDGQLEMVRQIRIAVEQISSVVQTNSATSEESAAASEEMAGQAERLKSLVGQFKLTGSRTEFLSANMTKTIQTKTKPSSLVISLDDGDKY